MLQPLYVRIQDELRGKIAAGKLGPGDRVPSENILARRFQTTRTTVRQALAQLAYEGLIHRQAGLGTFVSGPRVEAKLDTRLRQSFEEQMEGAGMRVDFELLSYKVVPAPEHIQETMGLRGPRDVYRMERLRIVKDEIVGLEVRYILSECGVEIPNENLIRKSAVAFMDETSAGPVYTVIVSVRADAANPDVAAKLQMARGAPVLIREHRFYDKAGRVILCGDAIYKGDAYRFSYSLRYDGVTPSNSPIP
ncbi:MAG: GntR family transcriptional regulator [Proteobacteria bacterium]|nr:GntR family transcriptional regulator [Pseudomonadota bacterium]